MGKREKAVKQLKKIEKLLDGKEMRLAAEWDKPWQALISTILSAVTRDDTTIYISNKLYHKYSTLEKLSKAKLADIKKIIKPVNFYKTKAEHILETARIIENEWKGEIPQNREELMLLPGVGRKVANVYLAEVHRAATIGVDTHLTFLSQQLGWTKNKTQEKIERDLEHLFPRRYWNSINYLLVRFGRTYPSRKKQIEILKRNKAL